MKKNARRMSVESGSTQFNLNLIRIDNNGRRARNKIKSIRTKLLLLINDEFLRLLRRNSVSKVNHKSMADIENEYNKERYINLKPEVFSPRNNSQYGEGFSRRNKLSNKNVRMGIGILERGNETIGPTPTFYRNSLAKKKLERFSKMINQNEYTVQEQDQISILSIGSPSDNGNSQEGFHKGLKFLRELAYSFKFPKPRKSYCLSPTKFITPREKSSLFSLTSTGY